MQPVRISATRGTDGWHIWIGLDAQAQQQLPGLVQQLQTLASQHGLKIIGIIHNGRVLENTQNESSQSKQAPSASEHGSYFSDVTAKAEESISSPAIFIADFKPGEFL
jgi:hypothetical protein